MNSMRRQLRYALLLWALLYTGVAVATPVDARSYLREGWAQLSTDNDILALQSFATALELARQDNDQPLVAEALLYMGICSYGASYVNGLKYAGESIQAYHNLEATDPVTAAWGRSRCLQLISTIYSRQGKYRESVKLSLEAMSLLPRNVDTNGTLGLIYNSLGTAYDHLDLPDSAAYYFQLSLDEYRHTGNSTYLPAACIKAGDLALATGQRAKSKTYYEEALHLAEVSGNRQAKVMALRAIGLWSRKTDTAAAGQYLYAALQLAATLTDKSFYLSALEAYIGFKKELGDYKAACAYGDTLMQVKAAYFDLEQVHIARNLEAAFHLSEKDRQLALLRKEKKVILLRNAMLWGGVITVILVAALLIVLLRRINKRNRQLFEAREQVRAAEAERQKWQTQQMEHALETKDAQLSALALQMYQKNELMNALKEKLEQAGPQATGVELQKIINRGAVQDQEWADFDTRFEHINKHFYTKLKQLFPEISPNDLKICALIKLNLSIKEMAGILNISPDSVKTARYRLRKKLRLHTEDNLTDFIMGLA